ncbi:hypothetical protein [Desulfofalx alkaliphila]|nr:hypothetical protein [Desulfofalx alkaliphila]
MVGDFTHRPDDFLSGFSNRSADRFSILQEDSENREKDEETGH